MHLLPTKTYIVNFAVCRITRHGKYDSFSENLIIIIMILGVCNVDSAAEGGTSTFVFSEAKFLTTLYSLLLLVVDYNRND